MTARRIWIDAHVHLYPLFSLEAWLNQASKSFLHLANGCASQHRFVLCLTEGVNENSHARIAQAVGSPPSGWVFRQIDECLYQATNADITIQIVLSKQMVSSEGIELLVIGTTDGDFERQPLSELVERYSNESMILPWGFGKWLGKRGKIIRDIVERASSGVHLWLGDSGQRPSQPRDLKLFELAPLLSGTDPLPMKGQECKVGSFGTVFNVLETHVPSDFSSSIEFKELLTAAHSSRLERIELQRFGHLPGMMSSLWTQFILRVSK